MTHDHEALRAPVTHPFEDVQFWETKRQITHAEARESATRLINSHFRNDDRARVSIPADPDRDDDLIIQSYIRQQARAACSGDLIHRSKISEETARAGEAMRERCAKVAEHVITIFSEGGKSRCLSVADRIRALPLTEEAGR